MHIFQECVGVSGVAAILGLKSHACFILLNSFLNGLVDTRPEDTTTGKQLCFGDALM